MNRSLETQSNVPLVVLGENFRGTPASKLQSLSSNGKDPLSPASKVQARAAGELLREVDFPVVIFSTGDTAGLGVSEARAMCDYMGRKFPDLARTREAILEEVSIDTESNAIETGKVLEDRCLGTKINLLAPHYHAERAVKEFERQGISVVNIYHPDEILAETEAKRRFSFNPLRFLNVYRSLPQTQKEYRIEKLGRRLLSLPGGRLAAKMITTIQRKILPKILPRK